jgi:hypothetical protein
MSTETGKAEILFEEVLELRPSAVQVLDLDRRVEKEMSDIEQDIRFMFREAVADSLTNLLDPGEARAIVVLMGGTNLEDPEKVYGALDSILQGGSHVLKDAIAEEFREKVDLLKRKLEGDPDSIIWVAKFVLRMEGKHRR